MAPSPTPPQARRSGQLWAAPGQGQHSPTTRRTYSLNLASTTALAPLQPAFPALPLRPPQVGTILSLQEGPSLPTLPYCVLGPCSLAGTVSWPKREAASHA